MYYTLDTHVKQPSVRSRHRPIYRPKLPRTVRPGDFGSPFQAGQTGLTKG